MGVNNIERLFGGDRPVPGMRRPVRVAPVTMVPEDVPLAAPRPEIAEELARASRPAEAIEAIARERESIVEAEPAPEAEASASAVDQEFPLALLGPLVPSRHLRMAHDPASPYCERMRQLRTELLLRHRSEQGAMAIAVVGAGAGVGRSQLCAELALAFAQLGRGTLLIDADLRNPRQHELFGTKLGEGLAQSLVRGDMPTIYGVAGFPTLSLIMAGTCESNPIELLSDGRFAALMDELRNHYEFIVVDTPRFVDYGDAQVISTIVGHVLTVHRVRHTPYKAAREMFRQLASARADILGGVLSRH